MFQGDWYVRERFGYNANFVFAYVGFYAWKTPGKYKKLHPAKTHMHTHILQTATSYLCVLWVKSITHPHLQIQLSLPFWIHPLAPLNNNTGCNLSQGHFQKQTLGLCQGKVPYLLCFPHGSAGKNLPAMQEMWTWSLSREKGMATHSSILAWRILWTQEPGRLHSRVTKE